MAAEYRQKFPDKAVINNCGQGDWAYVCAGGSLPNLPRTTDVKLLAAIPRMAPWAEASGKGRWVLRQAGKQFLICGGAGAELDLSGESGAFRVSIVNPTTGEVALGALVQAGRMVKLLEAKVVWLTRE